MKKIPINLKRVEPVTMSYEPCISAIELTKHERQIAYMCALLMSDQAKNWLLLPAVLAKIIGEPFTDANTIRLMSAFPELLKYNNGLTEQIELLELALIETGFED